MNEDLHLYLRNDLLKLIYSGMLLNFPFDEVRAFWKARPLPRIESERNEADLYRFIWNEKNKTTISYVFETIAAFEEFLVGKGICPYHFVKEIITDINHGSLVGAKTLLLWAYPFIEKCFFGADLRTLALQCIPGLTQNMSPAFCHEMVRFDGDGQINSAWMMIMLARPRSPLSRQGRLFLKPLPAYDGELWSGVITQISPAVLSLPPFENLTLVCDSRSVAEVLASENSHCCGSRIKETADTVDAKTVPFHEFCDVNGLDLAKYQIPDSPVEIPRADLRCHLNKRKLLHKGCAYGAPVSMYKLTYKKAVEKPQNFLAPLFEAVTTDNDPVTASLQSRHAQLVEEATFKARFVYNVRNESISLNGRHLVKFVPAKILSRMINEYVVAGRKEFLYRDFSNDPSIVEGPKKANIDIRVTRLKELLHNQSSAIRILKKGNGRIILEADCAVEYIEK